ncbi:MAG: translation initiation factor IF-2 N-terminal domain-containing protein [Corynebacterium sp.]|uniref:translation initiation factor IF-2 N-terminal domain-containing protein n=1 Tax=Corynebacterium sp. TaxID=1720 RepID=UPI003F8E07CC
MAKTGQELAAAAADVKVADLGEKVRVHALAKALGIPSAQMITVLGEHGVENKRAASTVTSAEAERVLGEIGKAGKAEKAEKAPAKKAPAKKTPAKKAPAKKRAPRTTATKTKPAAEAAAAAEPVVEPAVESAQPPKEQAAPTRRRARSGKVTRKAAAPVAPAEPVEAVEPLAAVEPEAKPAQQSTAAAPEASETPETKNTGSASRRRRRRRVSRPAGQDAAMDTRDTTDGTDTADTAATEQKQEQAAAPKAQAPKKRAPKQAPKKQAEKKQQPQPEPQPEQVKEPVQEAAAEAQPEAEAPRPVVRRRIVRRVGSRSAAAGAEALRREREEENSVNNSGNNAGSNAPASDEQGEGSASSRRRRGSRGRGRGRADQQDQNEQPKQDQPKQQKQQSAQDTQQDSQQEKSQEKAPEQTPVVDEPVKLKGSTRLESKRRWRQEQGNEKHRAVTRAEFLARRENIFRSMVVRDAHRHDGNGWTTQVGVAEDGLLVEHFVTSDDQQSTIGNIYLGRVQNVLSSMEAAFVDIGTGRNAVLYASEVDWRSGHVRGRSRRIESALKQGDQVLVQVIKEPLGHKGARLTNRVSFAGRYLVYVPGGRTQGISRKLPEAERKRLKSILQRVVPEDGGTIIRTAAEGVSEEKIAEDVDRLHRRWVDITEREEKERAKKGASPVTMYEEPNLLVKVVRDMFNEDFNELVVDGNRSWQRVRDYVHRMAPDLESRVVRWNPEEHGGDDVFAAYELDAQLSNALSQKIWLPSGGYLIIDKTEAMTVIDVNTGSFVGSGGNLEETVTKNNLEAAEEIVRQMRLRDIGGMIVVDFVDMVLEENRDLLLRRLHEYLAADRTKHKVSEVTSLGLVQMTRKRLGVGLVETYSTQCETCHGRGIILHDDPVEHEEVDDRQERRDHGGREGLKQARHEQEIRKRYEDSAIEDAPAPAQEDQHATADATADATAEVAKTVHGTHAQGGRRRRKGSAPDSGPESVQDIVAYALSRAGEEDPDEPSGSDYVSDEEFSESADDATEQLLRGIVQDEPAQDVPAQDEPTQDAPAPVATSRRKDRRGRRVVRRVAPAEPVVEPAEPAVEQVAEAAAETAGDYESAKEAFERSPRRRRRVRGNSRSDVAPRPQDYGAEASDAGRPAEPAEAVQDVAESSSPEPARSAAPQVRSDRRGRRRVVRSAR